MGTEDGSLWIVYNGEIYNYLEVREELRSCGHRFVTESDTEVILKAYQQWNVDCLPKFNGMWAFALWDKPGRRLFCARDRFGIKPFHYCTDGRAFAFSSEIKPLFETGISRLPNEGLIHDYLILGLLDHTSETFFQGIHKLPQGHYLLLGLDGRISVSRYWDLEVSDQIEDGRDDRSVNDQFRGLFEQAVRIRLRSDVPIGSCLSGGLDSSSVVCMASRILQEGEHARAPRMQTFSACFHQRNLDERPYMHEIAQVAGTEPNLIYPSFEGFRDALSALLSHQEEPFDGSGVYAQWSVLEAARAKGIPVLLDGQGADELLGGYRKFALFYMMKLHRTHRYASLFREAAGFFLNWNVMMTLPVTAGLRYFKLGRRLVGSPALFDPGFLSRHRDRTFEVGFTGNLGARLRDDLLLFSLPALLRYEDRNSMAHSVESRLPFLDVRLAEFIAQLPLNQKIRKGWRKYITRESLAGVLPDKVRLRRSKLGFSTPENTWIRTLLKGDEGALLERPAFISPLMDPKHWEPSVKSFIRGRSHLPGKIFLRLYLLERWGRMFLHGRTH
jgi:asparagine synthase (glutamine-hydrolysing)